MKGLEYLIGVDFDDTVADTSAESPDRVTVASAYQHAVETIFGSSGVDVYRAVGGLQNRAPLELVDVMLKTGDTRGMTGVARDFFDSASNLLRQSGLISEGKGYKLDWSDYTRSIAELLVRVKLEYLLNQISPAWPEPCPGAVDFFTGTHRIREEEEINIRAAIVSSGHEVFIKRVFEQWGISCPELMVTDDDMRGGFGTGDVIKDVKPSARLWNVLHFLWAKYCLGDQADIVDIVGFVARTRQQMMYIGNDPVKDGGLAENAGVPFALFKPSDPTNLRMYCFNHWSSVTQLFSRESILKRLRAGTELRPLFIS